MAHIEYSGTTYEEPTMLLRQVVYPDGELRLEQKWIIHSEFEGKKSADFYWRQVDVLTWEESCQEKPK
jgi:hypothetical protein